MSLPRERAVSEVAELEATLERLSTEDPEQALVQMTAALFPDGPPDIGRLTWDDRAPALAADTPEARLRAAEARYRTLVEQIPALTFMAVLGEGKNEIYVSPHIETMLGYSQDEWLSDPFLWYYRLHPDDRPLWNAEFARGCRTGGPFRADCRFIARDGRVVWVHGEARLVRDERGRPQFLQGVAFDITESKRAQELVLENAVRTAKHEEELEIARRVQTSLVPTTFDVDDLEIAAMMIPASEVGGDYYDVLPTPDGAWIGIGDVSGHGLSAGLVMLMVQSSIASAVRARPASTPREILCFVNDVVVDNVRARLGRDDHVTLSLFRYYADGRCVVAGAHEDVIILRADRGTVEVLRPRGTWLGARRGIHHLTFDTQLELRDGDVLVLYTDGVTEAMNERNEFFDFDGLCAAVEEMRGRSPAEIVEHVMGKVRAHMAVQKDDITILAARFTRS
jgi:PAS domain S-box-containing protein